LRTFSSLNRPPSTLDHQPEAKLKTDSRLSAGLLGDPGDPSGCFFADRKVGGGQDRDLEAQVAFPGAAGLDSMPCGWYA
jgi:hypothetical protein